ncbi:MAG: hypothetical protein KA314_05110 [Chloroflexi bacterium]|nr:hypothetical protein [Chloroflexota bacterium]
MNEINPRDMTVLAATIEENRDMSNSVYLGRVLHPYALKMPADWDGATITFQTGLDGTTWSDVYLSTGDEYTVSVAAANWVLLDPTCLEGLGPYIKLRSGTSQSLVTQTAEREVGVYVRQDD